MDKYIDVFLREKKIFISKDVNFIELRIKILCNEKRLIKYFIFGVKKMKIWVLIYYTIRVIYINIRTLFIFISDGFNVYSKYNIIQYDFKKIKKIYIIIL